jgi:hypothetical protein
MLVRFGHVGVIFGRTKVKTAICNTDIISTSASIEDFKLCLLYLAVFSDYICISYNFQCKIFNSGVDCAPLVTTDFNNLSQLNVSTKGWVTSNCLPGYSLWISPKLASRKVDLLRRNDINST